MASHWPSCGSLSLAELLLGWKEKGRFPPSAGRKVSNLPVGLRFTSGGHESSPCRPSDAMSGRFP